tara:strand:- start:253 stop:450 length:198 start_codon:yes stop_codon:yes gene_type:complete
MNLKLAKTLCIRVLPFNWRWAIMGPTEEEIASWKKWREEPSRYSEEEQNRLRKLSRRMHSPNEQW